VESAGRTCAGGRRRARANQLCRSRARCCCAPIAAGCQTKRAPPPQFALRVPASL
jgi:hypothetical protein